MLVIGQEQFKKAEFYTCYHYFKVLWAAKTREECEQAKALLNDARKKFKDSLILYRN